MEPVLYTQYRMPLLAPIKIGRHELPFREGILIRVGERYAEAAPILSHSQDSLEENVSFLRRLGARGAMDAIHSRPPLECPSALRFAFECLAEAPSDSSWHIQSNALVTWAGIEATLERVRQLHVHGYKCFKIKAPADSVEDLCELLNRSRSLAKLSFRVDPNMSWTAKDYSRFENLSVRAKVVDLIEYVEEPTKEIEQISDPMLPIAADESASSTERIEDIAETGIPVIIFKPMVLGGIHWDLARRLESNGIRITYTSCLESSVGRRHLINALARRKYRGYAGLGTGFLFSTNFLPDSPSYSGAQVPSEAEIAFLETLAWTPLN